MFLLLKCLHNWFQYLVVIIKVEWFRYDLYAMQQSKEYYQIFDLNSKNVSQFEFHEKIRFECNEKIRFELYEKIRFECNEKIRFEFYEKIRFECNEKIRFEFHEKIRFEFYEKIRSE